MSRTSSGSSSEWSGDMLDRPEMVEAFTVQLRRVLADQADFVARIRRDAEAMWKANRPEGYGSFEAWWRHRWLSGPFADIQEHLEAAAKLTFRLEARYRRGRHEIPAARRAVQARKAPAITPGPSARSARPSRGGPPAPTPPGDFLDLVRDRRDRSA